MRTSLSILSGITAAVALAFMSPATASAQQVIHGQILEDRSNLPVEGAHVILASAAGRMLDRVQITNKHGVFIMPVEQGVYKLRIKRIGFDSLDTQVFDVRPKTNVQLKYLLTPRAARLAKQEIKEMSGLERGRDGMSKREPLGKGTFLYEKDIREIASLPVYEILGRVPGLRTNADGSLRSLEGNQCLQYLVNRLPVTEIPDLKIPFDARFASLYQMLPNGVDIAGVEVYPKFADVPREFQHDAWPGDVNQHGVTPVPYIGQHRKLSGQSVPACGLVNIWTRAAW